MKIGTPTWWLKIPWCPCGECDQGGLRFAACPQCRCVLLICDDAVTSFSDLRNLSQGRCYDRNARCPECGKVNRAEFRNATSDEIRAVGFVSGEYA
jgi:hypothetical protein